jgi:hypothetical protein
MGVNTFRIWNGRQILAIRKPSRAFLQSARNKRFLSSFVVATEIVWSLVIIFSSGYGLRQVKQSASRDLLYVPFALGWALLVGGFLLAVTVYFQGKPNRAIPPKFRSAAARRWID